MEPVQRTPRADRLIERRERIVKVAAWVQEALTAHGVEDAATPYPGRFELEVDGMPVSIDVRVHLSRTSQHD